MTDHKPTHRQAIRARYHSARTSLRVFISRVIRWWKRQDTRLGWKWRVANGLAAVLILSSVVTPVLLELQKNRGYHLSNATLDLVGKTDSKLTSKLTYDAKTKTYQFNKESIKEFNPVDQLKAQVGQPQQNEEDKALYSLDVPQDPKEGVTYYDTNSQLSFKLVPQFGARTGKLQQQRLVYPLGNNTQAVYTLKNNGLKEDIVVQKATEDTKRFSYILQLPKTLEARALEDGSGAIGIYSASPSLYSNISYGSDKDKELVEKARENGNKDTLVFGIPAPIITTTKGDDASQTRSRFELKGNTLTVVAEGLTSLKQPFSIDPSVVITSNSDFGLDANDEGNIDFGANNNDTRRNTLSGGTIGTWADQTDITNSNCTAGNPFANAVYNGYVYLVQGNVTCYAKLNTNGTINGTWQSGTAPPTNDLARAGFTYNGYLYITGGSRGSTSNNETYYIKLNSDGSTAANWNTGPTMTTIRRGHAAVAYNGYAYASGGWNGILTQTATVEKAQILPNGNLGAWASTTAMPTATSLHPMEAYNGFMYVTGGDSDGTNCYKTWYAPINTDGTLGSWIGTSTIDGSGSNPCRRSGSVIYKGYWYLLAGYTWGNLDTSTIIYAPVNANGSLGTWQASGVLGTGAGDKAQYPAIAVYNNYIFSLGGASNLNVYSAQIDSAGALGTKVPTTGFDTSANGRSRPAVAAANGYLYVLGGQHEVNGAVNTVKFAPINSDGTVGSWSTTNAFSEARAGATAIVYNNYLYLVGGHNNSGTTNCPNLGIGADYCTNIEWASINTSNGALTWQTTPTNGFQYPVTNTTGRESPGVAIINGYMYVVGGRYNNNTNDSTEVDYAPINSDGTLGTFTATTAALPTGLGMHTGIAYAWSGRLYAVGNASTTQIYYATPSNGNISSWTGLVSSDITAGNGRQRYSVTMNKGIFYLSGGLQLGGLKGDIYQATIQPNGSVSNWSLLPQTLTTNMYMHTMTTYNDNLYVVGGDTNATIPNEQETVYFYPINHGGGGASGSWTRNSEASGGGNLWNGSAAYGNYVYNVGGCGSPPLSGGRLSCGQLHSLVITTPICDGTMSTGGCTSGTANTPGTNTNTAPQISGARYGLTSVAYNGFLYAIGGCTATNGTTLGGAGMNTVCTTFASDVQYTSIASNGTLGTWVSDPDSFPTARYGHTSAVYNGYLYIMGGCSAATVGTGNCATMQSDVQYALICTGNNNGVDGCGATAGQVGTWHSGASFTTARMYHASAAYNGYLYVIGGCTALSASVCTTFNGDVQSIQLNSDGSTNGSWTVNRSINGARFGLAATAYNGHLYVAGGCPTANANMCSDGSAYNTVDVSAISPNGRLGHWNTSPTRLASTNTAHGLVVGAGNLIEVRGSRGLGTAAQSVAIAPLTTIPRKGLYSKLLTFNFGTSLRNITYNGTLANGLSDVNYRGSSSATSWTGSLINGISLTNARCPAPANNRYLQLFVSFDDTYRGAFPDESANTSNLTDLTLSYEFSRPPNMRLKLGKILQENIGQTDLDICKLAS